MIRVAGLHDQVDAGLSDPGPDGRTPSQVIDELRGRIVDLCRPPDARLRATSLRPQLAENGIRIVCARRPLARAGRGSSPSASAARSSRCSRRSPSASGARSRTSPTCRCRSPSSCATRRPACARSRASRFPKEMLPRFLPVGDDGLTFVALEEVIAAHLQALFPGHGGRRQRRVPRHPRRRLRGLRRGRRPARGRRGRAAPPPLRRGGAPRDQRRHERRAARGAHAGPARRGAAGLHGRGPARLHRPAGRS